MTQRRIIPAKEMTIITTGGLVPRMEITVTRPACKAPRESDTAPPAQKDDLKFKQGEKQRKD